MRAAYDKQSQEIERAGNDHCGNIKSGSENTAVKYSENILRYARRTGNWNRFRRNSQNRLYGNNINEGFIPQTESKIREIYDRKIDNTLYYSDEQNGKHG